MRDWPPEPIPRYRRAVFLDRDGTINVDTHYPYQIDELELIPAAKDGLRILAELPLHIIVVANQAGIALGLFGVQDMSRFNAELRSRVEHAGGRIDAFYYCPDPEPWNLPPGRSESASECLKPSPGMLLAAGRDFKVDLPKSFMVGDKTSDIAAGKRVGCTTILVRTGKSGKEDYALPVIPDCEVEDLYEAALTIRSYLEEEIPVYEAGHGNIDKESHAG